MGAGPWAKCASHFRTSAAAAVAVLVVVLVVVLALLLALGRAGGHRTYVGGAPSSAHSVVVDTLNLLHWLRAARGEMQDGRVTVDEIKKTVELTAPALRKAYPGKVVYVLKDRDRGGRRIIHDADVRATARASVPDKCLPMIDEYNMRVKANLEHRDSKTVSREDAIEAAERIVRRKYPECASVRLGVSADGALEEDWPLELARANRVWIYFAERYREGAEPRGPEQTGAHSEQGRDDFLAVVLARELRCGLLTKDRLRDFNAMRATTRPFLAIEYSPYKDLPVVHQYNPGADTYRRMRRPRRLDYEDVFGQCAEKLGAA
jgi:hypothetical protein